MRQPVEEWLGAKVVSEGNGTAVLQMTVTEQHVNGSGYLHGGVIFSLADAALAHAAIIPRDGATLNAQIAFIAPSRPGEEITATATTSTSWGTNSLVDVTVRAGDTIIAAVRGHARLTSR
ncbi:hotdog fold thioesterase [Microbacterium pumilum]|uniref:Thioesterase domain-containing protein n=1 Tax=Microbacterium pumilum TaxID=344165 RepID=A0ABN2T2V8_9MICO